jgi:two-component system nitrogen regulation sensor histidine kinase GlnL
VNFFAPHSFSEGERETIRLLANQAAVAIENARLFRKLESTREQLVDAEKVLVLSRFAADFIHRVNNLVGTIPIWTQQIQDRLHEVNFNDVEVGRYLSSISADVRHVRDVTQQLMAAAEDKPLRETFDIVELMEAVARRLRIMAPEEISIVEKYPPQAILVEAVRIELETTVWDIAWNGIQAILPLRTGMLTLKVDHLPSSQEGSQDKVRIEIHDNGIGVPQGQPLFKSLSSTKGGLGYGLWRAKKVIEELKGNIDFTSVPGNTTFWINLPEIQEAISVKENSHSG